MGKFHVVERFVSINGEARLAGELAVFIRFAGCNLNCSYCDTRWANEEKAPFIILSEEEIYEYIKDTGIKNITLTGGEPLIQPNIERLLTLLSKDKELRIEVETNGSVSIKTFKDISDRITFTLDYKVKSSGMEDKMCLENYEILRPNDTVKFVVSNEEDLDKMREIVSRYKLAEKAKVYVSTVFGKIEPSNVVDYMVKYKLNDIRLQLQMHKYIWDPDRKGV